MESCDTFIEDLADVGGDEGAYEWIHKFKLESSLVH